MMLYKVNPGITPALILLMSLMRIAISYSSEKVSAHFLSCDRDRDGLLSREEYMLTLQEDDR